MGFWENFWLFTPPLILVLVGLAFFLKTAPDKERR